jgi:hypothetical protein
MAIRRQPGEGAEALRKLCSRHVSQGSPSEHSHFEQDLDALQKKALEEGVPYQTLISSLIHKFVSGRLRGF